ncbi:MAG: hypothetical protein ACRDFB_04755, partial [Rhabdochlamydiaceae bacterium]
VETALENLMDRLNGILTKHKNNIPILLTVIDTMQEAEKDLSAAQALLTQTKQEFEEIIDKISTLKMMIYLVGLDQDTELNTLIQKTNLFLNHHSDE